MDNIERDKQIMKTLELINFIDFSVAENYPSICCHYQSLNWDITKTIVNIDEIKEYIWYAVLNYLYTGEWGQYNKLTEKARKAFGLAIFKEKVKNSEIKSNDSELSTKINIDTEQTNLISNLSGNWNLVFKAHETYLNTIFRFIKIYKKTLEIENIIIYEAPPFPKKGKLNYLLIEKPKPSGPYSSSISVAFKENGSIRKKLIMNNVLFFDLLMLPIPLSSSIRREWSTKEKFKINGKQLPVVLFEMNLEHYLNKLKKMGVKPSKDIKIAIGTPHLTSLGIYNHFCKKSNAIKVPDGKVIIECLIECNKIKNKIKLKNYVVPLFKSCFVNASNNPDKKLLEHALDLPKKKKP